MSNYNSDILIENIKSHMSKKGITQEKLAEKLGMSQSNVSKALSTKDKKSFTLDQVVGIAKFFNVSVDSLIGESRNTDISLTPRSIATFIARMIEDGKAELISYKKEEDIYEIDGFDYMPEAKHYTKEFNYPGLYLPSYWYIPSDIPYDEAAMLQQEISQVGNDTAMLEVNKFLKQFHEIHSIYKSHGLSDETYRSVLSDMLSHLRD